MARDSHPFSYSFVLDCDCVERRDSCTINTPKPVTLPQTGWWAPEQIAYMNLSQWRFSMKTHNAGFMADS